MARSEGGATRIVSDRDRGVGESCSCEAIIVENRNSSDSGLLYAEVQTGSRAHRKLTIGAGVYEVFDHYIDGYILMSTTTPTTTYSY